MLNFLNVDEHKHSMIEVKEQIWINTGHYWDKKQLLDDILNDGEKKSELLNILNNNINTNKSHYKFYTDGSLMERNKVKKMGIGWLLKNEEENNTDLEFKAANVGWPSSTKAEILAILIALIVTTPHSKIEIYTDSANAISQFEKYKKELSLRKKMKYNQHVMWKQIFNIIQRFSLKVILFKVKAHNNDKNNDKADFLAKEGINDSYILIKDKNLENTYCLNWYNITVEEDN